MLAEAQVLFSSFYCSLLVPTFLKTEDWLLRKDAERQNSLQQSFICSPQSALQRVPRNIPWEKSGFSVNLQVQFHLESWLPIHEIILPFARIPL